MSLSSILQSRIQLTETNKIWNFEENRSRKLNNSLSSKTMIISSLFPSSCLIFSSKTMIVRVVYHYSYEIEKRLCFSHSWKSCLEMKNDSSFSLWHAEILRFLDISRIFWCQIYLWMLMFISAILSQAHLQYISEQFKLLLKCLML